MPPKRPEQSDHLSPEDALSPEPGDVESAEDVEEIVEDLPREVELDDDTPDMDEVLDELAAEAGVAPEDETIEGDALRFPLEGVPHNNQAAAEKALTFPQVPGVYLMKDVTGVVIYIGKAKNLRSRARSYFLAAAAEDPRTAWLVREIRDIDYLQAESEIDAILMEARLIKDIQPKYNRDLRDGKSFPYLEITTREDFPRIRFSRSPDRNSKLFGPFVNPRGLRAAIVVLQKIFKFRTCELDIDENDERWRWFRPCLLASIQQCSAPCNRRISKEEYRKQIRRLQRLLSGDRKKMIGELREEMKGASAALRFEEAAMLRDEIEALESLDQRGSMERHAQPEVFPIDPKRGLAGLQQVLKLKKPPRVIEGIDIAHLGGGETVASLVCFVDGLPLKSGYRRFRIRTVTGIDDYASMREAVVRRMKQIDESEDVMPDILLIDGGRGQLNAAQAALDVSQVRPDTLLSLAKKEELVYLVDHEKPLRLSRHSYSLRLLQYVRDEAHRFAQHYHHILRRKSTLGE